VLCRRHGARFGLRLFPPGCPRHETSESGYRGVDHLGIADTVGIAAGRTTGYGELCNVTHHVDG